MALKRRTGAVARGKECFFERPKVVSNLWRKLEQENNVLIAAPRRVGKTSLMYYLLDNPHENYHVIYVITESVNSENEYYKRIINTLIEETSENAAKRYSHQFMRELRDFAARIKSFGAAGVKVELDGSKLDYYEAFVSLVKSLDLQGKKILIMVDEFAQTLENIITDQSESAALHLLETNRELRMTKNISEKVQFVYTGSIGLETVVSRLGAINLINDLYSFPMPPLNKTEAKCLIEELTENSQSKIPEECVEHILRKTEWLLPFYIQLIIEEIEYIYSMEPEREVDLAIVDQAFSQILNQRTFFEHWHTRLRKSYIQHEYDFAKELLNQIAEIGKIDTRVIVELAQKRNIEENYKNIINSLVYDGYINNNENTKVYRFNSPILKEWWYKNVAN